MRMKITPMSLMRRVSMACVAMKESSYMGRAFVVLTVCVFNTGISSMPRLMLCKITKVLIILLHFDPLQDEVSI